MLYIVIFTVGTQQSGTRRIKNDGRWEKHGGGAHCMGKIAAVSQRRWGNKPPTSRCLRKSPGERANIPYREWTRPLREASGRRYQPLGTRYTTGSWMVKTEFKFCLCYLPVVWFEGSLKDFSEIWISASKDYLSQRIKTLISPDHLWSCNSWVVFYLYLLHSSCVWHLFTRSLFQYCSKVVEGQPGDGTGWNTNDLEM